MMIDFDRVPPVGTVMKLDEQAYSLAAAEPYQRKDGGDSHLLRWQSHCPDCGEVFETTTGLRCGGIARRCTDHRNTAKVVRGKRGRPVRVTVVLP